MASSLFSEGSGTIPCSRHWARDKEFRGEEERPAPPLGGFIGHGGDSRPGLTTLLPHTDPSDLVSMVIIGGD